MKNLVQSLDHRDEVETEMRNTVRQIQQQVAQNQTGSVATASVSEKHSGNGPLSKAVGPAISKGFDLVGQSFTGFVNGVHDIFASQEGSFVRQNVTGLAMLLGFLYALFKKPWTTIIAALGFGALNAGLDITKSEKESTDTKDTNVNNYGTAVTTGASQKPASTNNTTKNTPAKTAKEVVKEQNQNLNLNEQMLLNADLIEPLKNANIHELKDALMASEKEQAKLWEKIFKDLDLTDETKKKIQEALKNTKLKKALLHTIEVTLADPANKKLE